MASIDDSRKLFCVRHTNSITGVKWFINYVADPREDSSIKLPEFMLEMSKSKPGKTRADEEIVNEDIIIARRESIRLSVLTSLQAWYGDILPRVYRTKDGQNFVMNVHIYKDHAEALMKLPLSKQRKGSSTCKRFFLVQVLEVIQGRIFKLLIGGGGGGGGGKEEEEANKKSNLEGKLAMFSAELDGEKYKTPDSKRATKEELLEIVLGPRTPVGNNAKKKVETAEEEEEKREEQRLNASPWTKVGDHLFSFVIRDPQQKRALYHKVLASDSPGAISLPGPLIDFSMFSAISPAVADLMVGNIPTSKLRNMIGLHVLESLTMHHLFQKPDVFVAENNPKDLVIHVPFHIDKVPWLARCFANGLLRRLFMVAIESYSIKHFLVKSRRSDLEMNHTTCSYTYSKCPTTGRRATDEEIHSLLLAPKGSQGLNEPSSEQTGDSLGDQDNEMLSQFKRRLVAFGNS